MFKSNTVLAASALVTALGLSACDVKKTQEAEVTMPKYEVQKKQEGNLTLPKYDVTAPEVTVNKKETEVTVPVVKTEQKTMTVPTIELKTGQEKKAEEQARK